MKQKGQCNKKNTIVCFLPSTAQPLLLMILLGLLSCVHAQDDPSERIVPPSWKVLPIPRYVDYGLSDDFIVLDKVGIVRKKADPYHTIRDMKEELVGKSTITEEELTVILKGHGVTSVTSVSDDLKSYEAFDTLILLGAPHHNRQTDIYFKKMGLSFKKWDDNKTPEDDFEEWKDFKREGYLLKVGRSNGKNIIILAGYDFDDAKNEFYGAGTFYAMQSLRQMIIKEKGVLKIKTAEIADKPLVEIRACMSGFDPSEEQEWRNVALMPQMKVNQNVYWYGNGIVGYNAEATFRFRYPWKEKQLTFLKRVGKYCRERFVTMVFCMNPDHYNVEWAAAKTFDGSRKDPVHYNPNYKVELEFKEMWAKLGYEVNSDIDIIAAKYAQLCKAVPGSILTMMNEDDLFNLVHEDDKKLYQMDIDNPKQEKVNYGKARARFLVNIYERINEVCSDGTNYLPLSLPGNLTYQLILDRNEDYSREFLLSMTQELQRLEHWEAMPLMTTGGGTAAEVITAKQIKNFKSWCNGSPVLLIDNNFPFGFHIGAYETDPGGQRSIHQIHPDLPSGYREATLYKFLSGIIWNGMADKPIYVLAWCQSQYMWNMLGLEREKVNALATRKVCNAKSYPLVKSLYEEYDNPACYLPDIQPPGRILTISDRIAFPSEGGWSYIIKYTDPIRRECQKLRNKLTGLLPKLERTWENEFDKKISLEIYGYGRYRFCAIYLAYGYIKGWENETMEEKLAGVRLRDLYLEADNFQQQFFQGPQNIKGNGFLNRRSYNSALRYIYTDGAFKSMPETTSKADVYIDIWEEGLKDKFFENVTSINVGEIPDTDPRIVLGDWSVVQNSIPETFRTVSKISSLKIDTKSEGQLLLRIKIGTKAAALTQSTKITLSFGKNSLTDAICKPRWINWLLPEGTNVSELTIHVNDPVQIYTVELYKQKGY